MDDVSFIAIYPSPFLKMNKNILKKDPGVKMDGLCIRERLFDQVEDPFVNWRKFLSQVRHLKSAFTDVFVKLCPLV